MNAEEAVFYQRGCQAFSRGDYAGAERFLSGVLDSHRNYADLYAMFGAIYHDKGRFSDAIRFFTKALEINPGFTEAKLNLMVLLLDIGRYERAKNILRHIQSSQDAFPQSPDPVSKNKLANLHAITGDMYLMLELYNEAIHEYEEALSLRSGYVDIRLKLARAYKASSQIEIAEVQCRACLKARPDYKEARIFLGAVLMAQGRRTQAVDAWKQVIALDPQDEDALRLLRMAGAAPKENKAPATMEA